MKNLVVYARHTEDGREFTWELPLELSVEFFYQFNLGKEIVAIVETRNGVQLVAVHGWGVVDDVRHSKVLNTLAMPHDHVPGFKIPEKDDRFDESDFDDIDE